MWIVVRLRDDLDQRLSESVERLDRLGLRWLDEHHLGDGQGKVDRRRMKAVVDQALGDIENAYSGALFEARRARHDLVFAALLEGHLETAWEPLAQGVRVQDGV